MSNAHTGRPRLRVLVGLLAAAAALIATLAIVPGIASAVTPASVVVNMKGDGEGNVIQTYGEGLTSQSVDCTYHGGVQVGVCSVQFDTSSPVPPNVELHASPFAGSAFQGWVISGPAVILHGCQDSWDVCHIGLYKAVAGDTIQVYATFSALPNTNPLVVDIQGSGNGLVTSSPPGISCGVACVHSFPAGSTVTLQATPNPGSVFDGWGGDCAGYGTNPVCLVLMTDARAVIAKFKTQTAPLTVAFGGNGSGGVASSLAPPFTCTGPAACTRTVGVGTSVTLFANAGAGSKFTGWSGVCAAAGTNPVCTFTMPAAAATATASFTRIAVQASLTNVQTGKFGPTGRATKISITSTEPVRVIATIVRGGAVLASRQFPFAPSGPRLLTLPIPSSVASGKADLRVTFVNQSGSERKVSSPVTIPSL